jgi:hypothetical protein
MVVHDSVTFSMTQIGSHAGRSKALNHTRTGQHLLLSNVKRARHMSSVHHNWSWSSEPYLIHLKCERTDQNKYGTHTCSAVLRSLEASTVVAMA